MTLQPMVGWDMGRPWSPQIPRGRRPQGPLRLRMTVSLTSVGSRAADAAWRSLTLGVVVLALGWAAPEVAASAWPPPVGTLLHGSSAEPVFDRVPLLRSSVGERAINSIFADGSTLLATAGGSNGGGGSTGWMKIALGLVFAVLLVCIHLFAHRVTTLHVVPRSRALSAAGGASVGYVFVHILPELSEGQEQLAEGLGRPLTFLEHHIYLVALFGFGLFYGLERLAQLHQPVRHGDAGARGAKGRGEGNDVNHGEAGAEPRGDAEHARRGAGAASDGEHADSTADDRGSWDEQSGTAERGHAHGGGGEDIDPSPAGRSPGVYWVHMGSFAVYNLLIGYLLLDRQEGGLVALALFGVAMALHFVVNDHGLWAHHLKRYMHSGRWILAAGVLTGCGIAVVYTAPQWLVALVFALIAGGVVLNVIKEELPRERESRFWAFALGAILYTALLVTMAGQGHPANADSSNEATKAAARAVPASADGDADPDGRADTRQMGP